MADRATPSPIIAPDLGLISNLPRINIPDRGWSVVKNARFRFGRAEKVPGYVRTQVAALDSKVLGLYDFVQTDGDQFWIAVTRTKVWKQSPTDPAFVDITGGTPLTGLDTDFVDFTNFKDLLIITNGRDPLKKWDGTAASISNLAGAPPKAKRITTFQNHVMLAWIDPNEITPSPQKIQWSDLGLSETWVGGEAGSLSIVDEPSGVLEIEPLRDALIGYKEDAIYLIDYTGFPFTMSIRRLATGTGPFSSRVVVPVRDAHYYLGTDNQVYRMTLAGPESVGDKFRTDLFGEINFTRRDRSFGYLNENDGEVVWAIPTGGSDWPDIAYVYNFLEDKCGRRSFPDASVTSAAQKGVRQLQDITWDAAAGTWNAQTDTWNSTRATKGAGLVLHGDVNGRVHKHSSGELNADGTIIDADIETKMFDYGDASRKKRLSRVHVQYTLQAGTTLSIFVLTANAAGITPTANGPFTIVLDGSGDQWVDVNLTAVWFGYRFRNNLLNQTFALTGYIPVVYMRDTT